MEIWKDIKGYEGLYQISNLGKVKALERIWKENYGGKRSHPEMVMKINRGTDGYLQVGLCKNGKQRTKQIHKLVALHFISNPDNKPEINHKDGIKEHCQDWNLEWCTHAENQKHAFAMGLKHACRGEINGNSKLFKEDVILIRKLKNEYHIKRNVIADLFNVSISQISNIVYNKQWLNI